MRPFSVNTYHSAFETPKDSKEVPYSWNEYLKDCGGEIIVENSVHARNIFNEKWESNIVNWKGYYAESKTMHNGWVFASDHALNILIKMSPSESALYPDLVLSLSNDVLSRKRDLI